MAKNAKNLNETEVKESAPKSSNLKSDTSKKNSQSFETTKTETAKIDSKNAEPTRTEPAKGKKKIALVTGASSGMGKRICFELDSMGLDEIWGVALGTHDVEQMAKELKTPFRFFALDLTKDESFEKIEAELSASNVDISWLVNASGFGKFGRYDEIALASQLGMVDLNCKALTRMSLLALNFMSEGARMLQFGSVASFQPIPYIAVYGATKAYVLSFSRAMNRELKSRKISVTCICPFWTKTPFLDRATNTSAKQPVITNYVALYDPEKVAKRAVKGAIKRKDVVMFGFKAKAQTLLVKLLPHSLVMTVWEHQQKFKKKYKGR